jgi:hypothetical protein
MYVVKASSLWNYFKLRPVSLMGLYMLTGDCRIVWSNIPGYEHRKTLMKLPMEDWDWDG